MPGSIRLSLFTTPSYSPRSRFLILPVELSVFYCSPVRPRMRNRCGRARNESMDRLCPPLRRKDLLTKRIGKMLEDLMDLDALVVVLDDLSLVLGLGDLDRCVM